MEPVVREMFLEWQARRLPELVPRDVKMGLKLYHRMKIMRRI